MPTLASALGVDGGAIFQIAAVQDLRLDPKVIGLAFAMGVVSVPVQILAARLPLWRARRNLQLFLVLVAVECLVLALLVGLDTETSGVALVALGVTVLAEIGVSVLYAPSWQPLLNYALTSTDRQRVNSRGRAAGGVVVAGAVVAFGSGGAVLRTASFAALAAAALLLAAAARRLPAPDRPAEPAIGAALFAHRRRLPPTIKLIYVIFAVAGLAASWPLFLVYADQILWPDANLGMLGAVQLGGSLLAAVSWRPTRTNLGRVASRAALVLSAATIALAFVRAPVDGRGEEAVVVVSLAIAAASALTILMALLERAHQEVDGSTAVRAMTLLDVVASTSLQVGLLIGGLLISASAERAEWAVDPYRIWLVGGTAALAIGLSAPALRRARTT